MSTNRTENYGLHAWEAGDDFLRTEFNENFERLDGALGELVVTGTYTGDGTKKRVISLGFTPRAILVIPANGRINSQSQILGGMAVAGSPLFSGSYEMCAIVEGGIQVSYTWVDLGGSSSTYSANSGKQVYHYLALR